MVDFNNTDDGDDDSIEIGFKEMADTLSQIHIPNDMPPRRHAGYAEAAILFAVTAYVAAADVPCDFKSDIVSESFGDCKLAVINAVQRQVDRSRK